MRAVRFHSFGDASVLEFEDDVPEPHAGPGQVRIKVKAASVNPIDCKTRAGYLGGGQPLVEPAGLGRDATGTVDEIGEGVTGVAVGDEVFGMGPQGTQAEFTVLYAWAPVPGGWTVEQAGAAGLVSSTALAALAPLGDLRGRTLLVEGAAGGVGSTAVQVAVSKGATVIGTAGEGNHEYLHSLGAMPTTYGEGLADRVAVLAPHGVDVAIDLAGSGSLGDLVKIAGGPDNVVTIADFNAAALGVALAHGEQDPVAYIAEAASLAEQGALTMTIAGSYPVAQIADAHAQVERGHGRGKVVLTF